MFWKKSSFDRLSAETDIVGYPVLPLVRQLVEQTTPEHAKYIHWGATTQDIMDDASILQIREGLKVIRRELETLKGVLAKLAEKYRDT
jgi:adenylosuccinate lyase